MKRIALVLGAVVLVGALYRCTSPFDRRDERDAITIFGPWLRDDADAFAASVDEFSDRRDVDVRYTGSRDFAADLASRVGDGAAAPDLAVIPQPGLIDELRRSGRLVPFSDEVVSAARENFPEGEVLPADDGETYSLPYRSVVKSLVWYRPDVFEEHGWSVPRSLGELERLADAMSSEGTPPWCFGIFSGADTGWPATDWVEDLVLRRSGVDVYDEWVRGERGFSDPAIRDAFEEFATLVLPDGRIAGGRSGLLETELGSIPGPLFAEEPGCAMFKQASFATVWFPDGTSIGPDGDVDVFVLPGAEPDEAAPLLVSGDRVVQLAERPEVDDLLAFLATPEGADEWAAEGGYLSSRTSVDVERYYQPQDQRLASVFQEGRETRFDASDTMPPELRSAFFDAIARWVAGSLSYDDLAETLDEAVEAAGERES